MFGITTQITAVVVAIALSVGLSAGGVYVYKQRSALKAAQNQTELYKNELDKAKISLSKALDVNEQNKIHISQLTQEKADIQTSLNNLELHRRKDAVTINNLSETIRKQASNPANQVLLSPVLQSIIDQIQKNRATRQGEQK